MAIVLIAAVELGHVVQDHDLRVKVRGLLAQQLEQRAEEGFAELGADQGVLQAMARDDDEVVREVLEPCLQPRSDRYLPAPQLVVVILAGPHQHLEWAGRILDERAAQGEA
jgi:hypothetical protein